MHYPIRTRRIVMLDAVESLFTRFSRELSQRSDPVPRWSEIDRVLRRIQEVIDAKEAPLARRVAWAEWRPQRGEIFGRLTLPTHKKDQVVASIETTADLRVTLRIPYRGIHFTRTAARRDALTFEARSGARRLLIFFDAQGLADLLYVDEGRREAYSMTGVKCALPSGAERSSRHG
jgi:hypothetical protein